MQQLARVVLIKMMGIAAVLLIGTSNDHHDVGINSSL
jgi:hypothetical protein